MSRVLVPLAQGCEELEAITITDLLVRAGVEVTTAGLDDQPVTASRGTTIIPDTSIDAVLDQNFDLIVLPGGLPGADHLRDDENILALLKNHAEQGEIHRRHLRSAESSRCCRPARRQKGNRIPGRT